MKLTISKKSFNMKKAKFMEAYNISEEQYAYIRKVWNTTPKDEGGKATIEVPDNLPASRTEYKDELVFDNPADPNERPHIYYKQVPVNTNQPLPDNTYFTTTVNSDGSSTTVVGGSNNWVSKVVAFVGILAAALGFWKSFNGDK